MGWACLFVGLAAFSAAVAALLPLRGPLGSALSFIPGWVVGEAPLHVAVLVVAAVAALSAAGALDGVPGRVGAGLSLVACAGLAAQFLSGLRARRHFEAGLGLAGMPSGTRRCGAREARRVATVLPLLPRGVERIRDISYAPGKDRSHLLDVYRRAGAGPADAGPADAGQRAAGRPVLLYFHGGAWVMGDKVQQGLPMLGHLAERGFVCVTANYSLSPKRRWPQHVLDCKLALRWVKHNIASYGGDPALVFVAGASAGGHLAALVALTAADTSWQPGFELEDSTVAGCVALYGVYDLVDTERIGNPNLEPILHRHVFELFSAEELAAASPVSRVHDDAPAFLVVHGRNDVLVPPAAARAFVGALASRSRAPVAYVELPLAQHAFDNFWSPRTVHLLHAVENFLTAVTASRAAEREVGR